MSKIYRYLLVILIVSLIFCSCGYCAEPQAIDMSDKINEMIEVQDHAHQMADHARALNLPEEDEVIKKAQDIWGNAQKTIDACNYLCANYTMNDLYYISKTVKAEANGSNDYQLSKAAWCILNRVDINSSTIQKVVTAPNQFAYNARTNGDLYMYIAKDVMLRYCMEKMGLTDVGRTLPLEYTQFRGDGRINHYYPTFNDAQRGTNEYTDYLPNPYA